MTSPRTSPLLVFTLAGAAAAIFAADIFVPLGIAVWVLYLVPVALGNFGWNPELPILTALACTLFVVAAYFLSTEREILESTYSPINRTFGVVTLWLMAALSHSFVKSRRTVQLESWFKTAETGLSARMLGAQTLAALGDGVMTFIAEYTNALVGALYLTDGHGAYRQLGTYATSPDRPPASAFRAGEGIVGQTARDNRVFQVDDVPEGYLDVRSGMGGRRPKQLLVAPAAVDGQVFGVVELGFLRPSDASVSELLTRLSPLLASAIRAVNHGTRQRELLEETQRQAEELQAQQEELRVQNEELEERGKALQKSQSQLENQQAELEQVNSHLEEQTQSLEIQRDELARAQTEILRANTYKSEFLANMSHELRTPLNSSLILAKLLLDNAEGNLTAEQVQFARTIYSAGNDLLLLINDILDLSKIEAGKIDVRPENVSVVRVVDELSTIFAPVAAEKKLELHANLAAGTPQVIWTDVVRLQQILKNLLSNALKFTDQGGVTLDIGPSSDGRISLSVRDTGIGIPREQQALIFEAFRQADGTVSRKYGGTGLGLSISRDLARLLGGELNVESAPGRGSTFTLTLPLRFSGEPQATALAQSHELEAPTAAALRPSPVAAPAASSGFDAFLPDDREHIGQGGRVILIIEDDPAFSRIVQQLAHELEFQTVLASSGAEGLNLAERYRPSAIVLDVGLPDQSGLSVLDALKHNPQTRHIPVHMFSVADHTQMALEMGAAGYALKPIQRERLLSALAHLESKFTQELRRILVVEDDEAHREATCRLLASSNVETVPASSAARALELLESSTFDCMVMDLNLPDRTGFDLLDEISSKDKFSVPPVIVYTGRSLSREEEQRLRRFSSSIIVKGARSPERLLDEVTLFLHQVESALPADSQRLLRTARHREAVFEGRRILIVEDDVRNIFAITSVFEPKGATVEIARNGREAVEFVKNNPGVDLVLMDIMMPEMDGLQATREIRKQPGLANLPIVALTAKAMADDRESCLLAGANDYIAKPLDVDRLLSLARVWIRK